MLWKRKTILIATILTLALIASVVKADYIFGTFADIPGAAWATRSSFPVVPVYPIRVESPYRLSSRCGAGDISSPVLREHLSSFGGGR